MGVLLTTIYGLTIPQVIAIVVVFFVAVYIYVTIKEKKNRGKASTGEDKNTVWGILQKVVPDVENYTRAYASWEWQTYQGRTTKTTYWYYGIAFNDEQIYIVPLSCAGGDISYSDYGCIKKEDLGIVNSKKGLNWVELYDKNQKEICSLMIAGENLNEDKYHPVNIIQEEEAKAFIAWKDKWMDDVNGANGLDITGKMKKPVKKR